MQQARHAAQRPQNETILDDFNSKDVEAQNKQLEGDSKKSMSQMERCGFKTYQMAFPRARISISQSNPRPTRRDRIQVKSLPKNAYLIIMQPIAIRGVVANPHSSAPRRQAMATSLPVRI